MRILAIDPALRNTGFAIIECGSDAAGRPRNRALEFGVIENAKSLRHSSCFVAIRERLEKAIRDHSPEVCAVESIIYVQSYKTAIVMGAARAAALMAPANHGIEIREYAPKRVKQAIVGKGGAGKGQVAFMVRALLGLRETPSPDAADALAIGLTHAAAANSRLGGSLGELV